MQIDVHQRIHVRTHAQRHTYAHKGANTQTYSHIDVNAFMQNVAYAYMHMHA